MRSYLIAFDKFKDALAANEACEIAQKALLTQQPDAFIATAPLADGGDGFCDTLTRIAKGSFKERSVIGPRGERLSAIYGLVDVFRIPISSRNLLDLPDCAETLGVIEMASSSGIAQVPLDERNPWIATTHGVGDQIKAAIEQGADCLLIGVGGSATHDLGLGALASLGYRFQTNDGSFLSAFPTPQHWSQITSISLPDTDLLKSIPIRVACDVDNPLLGERGAAAVFGPQKGLKPENFSALETQTADLAHQLLAACAQPETLLDAPGGGAAGGIAFGFMASLHAQLVPGYELVKAWIGLDEKLAAAEVVITGEGRFDVSSLGGKGPGSLLKEALASQKEVYVFAGSIGGFDPTPLPSERLVAISPPTLPLPEALRATHENLHRCIRESFSQKHPQ